MMLLDQTVGLKIQELSITLFTQDLEPETIHPAVLQYLGIIPAQWELIKKPIYGDREVQLVFTNQVRLIVQPNQIIFAETIGQKKLHDVQITHIANAYLQTFSSVDYQAISIKPNGYVPFNSEGEADAYMSDNFAPSRPWKTFADNSINAVGLKLAYPYKSGNFYLDIDRASLEIGGLVTPAIWFAGNFNYSLDSNSKIERLEQLKQLIQTWRIDVELFVYFINKKFLGSTKSPSSWIFTWSINN